MEVGGGACGREGGVDEIFGEVGGDGPEDGTVGLGGDMVGYEVYGRVAHPLDLFRRPVPTVGFGFHISPGSAQNQTRAPRQAASMLSTFKSTKIVSSRLIRRVSPPVSPNKTRPTPVAVASSCNADHFDVGRATIIRDGCSANNSISSRECVPAVWARALRSTVAPMLPAMHISASAMARPPSLQSWATSGCARGWRCGRRTARCARL